jgi:hypothetical protein
MTFEEYNILLAKREGFRTAIFNTTALTMDQIDKLVNEQYPVPTRTEPHECVLSNGDAFKIEDDIVWTLPFLGVRWSRTDHTLADLKLLGELYKNPTRVVEAVPPKPVIGEMYPPGTK